MKVFEVITEYCEGDSKEITKTVQYVTSDKNNLKSIVDYFTSHCQQYEKDLIGVREVLTIVEHIKKGWK
jgi:ribosomal protein S15P/S13E